jgi:EAL domain-containing protein (putative c-di-GMP-specific phosphodiesterase class I)
VAEGADNERALSMLREWGCDIAPGFHSCRPLPPAALEAWPADPDSRRVGQPAGQRRLA